MVKLIILPNNKILKGIFIKINKKIFTNLLSLINKYFKLEGNCGGSGVCKTCSIFIREGFLKNNIILSCQLNFIKESFIIDII